MRLTHRGPVNMDIVLCITYPNVYIGWKCFILFQVSRRYLNWSLYQHPICGSTYWLGTEQASCHYMKQRWPFWQMHMCVIWPQWVNELSVLLKQIINEGGNMHVVVNLGAADLHIMNVVDADWRISKMQDNIVISNKSFTSSENPIADTGYCVWNSNYHWVWEQRVMASQPGCLPDIW